MENLELLVEATLRRDHLELRSLVQDLFRHGVRLSDIARPQTEDLQKLAIAAALLELFALRTNQKAPGWTAEVGASPEPFFLLEAATRMKRLHALCEAESPEPLKRRGLYAPPDFLSFT